MAPKKEKAADPVTPKAVEIPTDVSALIHRDNAGAATNVGLTEGRDNFATISALALEIKRAAEGR